MPPDPDQVLQPDHAYGSAAHLNGAGAGEQIIVGTNGLQVGKKVERILAVDLEREVGPEGQRPRVEPEPEVSRRSTLASRPRFSGVRR